VTEINVRGDGFHLTLGVAGYERDRSGESYDDNWLRGGVALEVAQPPAATFTANCDVAWQTSDLLRFQEALRTLLEDLTGVAALSTLEDQVEVTIRLKGGKGTVVRPRGGARGCVTRVRGNDRPELPQANVGGATPGQPGLSLPALGAALRGTRSSPQSRATATMDEYPHSTKALPCSRKLGARITLKIRRWTIVSRSEPSRVCWRRPQRPGGLDRAPRPPRTVAPFHSRARRCAIVGGGTTTTGPHPKADPRARPSRGRSLAPTPGSRGGFAL
jgi:hypothetical protein